jgi:putative phosphoribosyl transferase
VVRKLGAPTQEEYAIGAIAEGVRVLNADAVRGVTPEQIAAVVDLERIELRRRTELFAAEPLPVVGRIVIVVDDGVATGATVTAACRAIRTAEPAEIVLAVPVAPVRWRPGAEEADAFVCAHPMRDFWAVGQFYEDFTQTTDEEVARLLRRASTGSATDGP